MSIWCRKNKDGKMVYGFDYRGPDGVRRREVVGPLKGEAVAAEGKIKASIREGKWFDRAKKQYVPFDRLVEKYEEGAKGMKCWRTQKHYVARIKAHFAKDLVGNLKKSDIVAFRDTLTATPTRTNAPRGPADVNRHMACLQAMLKKAVELEMLEANPAAKIKKLREPDGRNIYLSLDEASRLLAAARLSKNPLLHAIVATGLETGMRKSEITGLKWSEIRNGMIYLPGERTKNGKPREIPVSQSLREEFRRLKAGQAQQKVVALKDFVFQAVLSGRRKAPGPVKDFRAAWVAAKTAAGIDPGFRFHDIRHTTASWLKMSGVDDLTTMRILGHRGYEMMVRYAHLSSDHLKAEMAKLPAWETERKQTSAK